MPAVPAEFLLVMTTTDSDAEAARLAGGLVEARLAACVQVVGPMVSTYRWRGQVERAAEWLCLVKTTAERYGAVESWLAEQHSYDTPEITAVPLARGSVGYLGWLADSVSAAGA
jgi:periplasmic divalent cation tolerance protein